MKLGISKRELIIDVGKYGQERQLGEFALSLAIVSKGDKKGILSVVGIVDSERPSFLELFVFDDVLR